MVRKASHSDLLTEANIQKVISLLSGEKPITKKVACEILGITYNTTRLGEIIQKYKDKLEFRSNMFAKKKGKAPDRDEITEIVRSYLEGEPISGIGERVFRGTGFVKTILKDTGCPIREPDSSYINPPMIGDEAVKKDFEIGERCYSAVYQSLAVIKTKEINKDGDPVYRIWLESEDWLQYAYQPWWELASLDKIKQFGVKI